IVAQAGQYGAVTIATIEAWKEGKALSFVALGGSRNQAAQLFSSGSMMHTVLITASVEPTKVVALWQNCCLPEEQIIISGRSIEILLPKDAAELDRSYLRVYASTNDALFNDVLIPLQKGKVVRSTDQLTRRDHHAQVLYSLMIDRFYDADPANNQPLNSPEVLPQADYQGGDLKGITAKIKEGFFERLGVSTIWISPITQNPRDAWGLNLNPRTKFSGYHGYWPIYPTEVDDRFGTSDELKEMLATAHEAEMNVVLDYVANHLHINSPVLQEHPDWIIPLLLPDGRKNLGLWDEHRLTTWFDEHIPSLDLERQEVAQPMTDSATFWMTEYDFDGFRHDACKHIPLGYWRTLTKKLRERVTDRELWQIGETYGDPNLIGSYVRSGMINAQFDFNVYHTALDVLTRDHSVERLAWVVNESLAAYGAHHTMGNITGNHDKGRLISLAGGALHPDEDHKAAGWLREVGVGDPVGYKKLALINALNMTIPGVPCIYQGDEYGEPGGNDPDNRRMMRFDGYNEIEQAQFDRTAQLVHLRRSTMPLLYGDMQTLHLSSDVWVYVRVYMGEWTLVALNTGYETRTVEVSLPTTLDAAQPLQAQFGNAFEQQENRVTLTLPACEFEILTKK
ncbi:MAG: alpha-glucosidase C-terminal domain-containing protein, partial [Alistipes sp.]|nr:alpha-glucosidase C-terminal domain-containing protein [Alistipes sp.]